MMASLARSVFLFLASCLVFQGFVQADDWPQWRGPQRDGVWRETGLMKSFSSPQLKIRWRVPVAPGYSGPTVAAGKVFLTDRVDEPEQIERVHCFDEMTGKKVWSFQYSCEYSIGYNAGPRAAVNIDSGRAYSLGAMGHLHCFVADSGKLLWKKDLDKLFSIEMPIWGIAGAPLVVDDLLIVQAGGKDACVVAFDAATGQKRWAALSDRASYSSLVLVKQAGKNVVVAWTGDSVSGLDPGTGKVHWRYPFAPSRMPIGVATPIISGDQLFVTSFYDGSLMLRLPTDRLAVEKVWQRKGASELKTAALHSIISTPLFLGKHIYGVDSYGELRCLEAASGERVWEDLTATPKARWSTIHFVRNQDRVWMFNERGELIIARLSADGFQEISRARLLEPTEEQLRRRNGVCWAHPAFANRHVYARNDRELVCASLAATP
ncbi:MAG: PQQ-binding-like beta-propeller repeat protein [Planctomycetota bacterium]|nr:PQQ-binding-like beta-propeller repeat protein [Planctomycetota bacterium]